MARIVHCLFTFETGGAQVLVVELLNSLFERGEAVSLIIVNREWNGDLVKSLHVGIPVHYIDRVKGSKNPWHLWKIFRLLRKIDPDIVHCHEPNMGNFLLGNDFKKILTVHTVALAAIHEKRYDLFTAVSETVAEDIRTRFGVYVQVIGNGVDMQSFKRKTDYSDRQYRIVQIGRLLHQTKGQDLLIRALKELMEVHRLKNVSVDFIGDGPSLHYLKQLAKDLNFESNIQFLGEKSRGWISEHLSDYTLLAQPSRIEGFGLTVVEGIAAGLPIIASDVGGPNEILSRTNPHFLFPAENTTAFATGLLEIFNLYENKSIQRLMERVYEEISKTHSFETMLKKYQSLYISCKSK